MENEDLKHRFSEMSDEHLKNIVSKDFSSYMPEALELVRQELLSRGIVIEQPEFDYLNDVPEIKEKNMLLSTVYWISSILIGLWILTTLFFFGLFSFLFPALPKWWIIIPILVMATKLFAVLCIRFRNMFGYIVNLTLSTVMLAFWVYIIAEEAFDVFTAVMAVLEAALLVLLVLGRKQFIN